MQSAGRAAAKRVVERLTDLEIVVLNSHTRYDHTRGNHQFETIYGRKTDYTIVRAASGAKYAAEPGIVFRTEDHEALAEWPQGNRFNCERRP